MCHGPRTERAGDRLTGVAMGTAISKLQWENTTRFDHSLIHGSVIDSWQCSMTIAEEGVIGKELKGCARRYMFKTQGVLLLNSFTAKDMSLIKY